MLFKDRFEAGHVLATKLDEYAGKNGVMVLALPRGGVPVGYEVARVYCLERMTRVADAAISGRRFQNGKPFAQKLADSCGMASRVVPYKEPPSWIRHRGGF